MVQKRHGARQTKHDVRKLKDIEIMPKYKKETRKWIIQINKQQNNQNEDRSETKSEDLKQVVRAVASAVSGYEERQKRNDWNDEQCLIKVNERNRA
jgi:hypothetical protein